jgi:hypothetical protein
MERLGVADAVTRHAGGTAKKFGTRGRVECTITQLLEAKREFRLLRKELR